LGILRQITETLTNGTENIATIFKPSMGTAQVGWGDGGPSSGTPKYQPYVGTPLVFTPIVYSGGNGVWLGDTDSLLRLEVVTTVTAGISYFYLCDYVGFYPKIDLEDETPQVMDNTLTIPRYTDGKGLVAFVTVSVLTGATNGVIQINWTDERDQARVTTCAIKPNSITGTIASTRNASQAIQSTTPFILNSGVKRVDSVLSTTQVNGFVDIVLCKPLATISVPESGIVAEKSFIHDMGCMPTFEAGAYLNLVYSRNVTASLSATVATITTVKGGQ